MQIRISSLFFLAVAIGFSGCDASDPIPLPMARDARVGPPISEMGVDLALPRDAAPDARPMPSMDMMVTHLDQGVPDYVVDVPPEQIPKSGEYVFVGGGDSTTVVWWRGGRIFMKTFEAQVNRNRDAGVPGIEPIDPESVDLVAGETQFVGYQPSSNQPLLGIRPPNRQDGHPGWVILPDAEAQGWSVLDLNHPAATLQPLGLFGDLVLGARSAGDEDADQALVYGKVDRDGSGPTGLVVLGEGLSSSPRVGDRGRPLPQDITTTGDDWIFAYDDGICVLVEGTGDGPSTELGSWPCSTGPGAKLIGRGPVSAAEPGFYAVGQTETWILAWDPRPGIRVETGNILIPMSPDTPSETGDGGTADAGVDDGSVADGSATDSTVSDQSVDAAALMDAAAPDAGSQDAGAGDLPMLPEQDGVVHLADSSAPIRWLNQIPNGRVGRAEGGETYIFERFQIRRLAMADDHQLGVISATGGAIFEVHWNPETGDLEPRRAQTDATLPTPRSGTGVCAGRIPEACDHLDHDCDGLSSAFMCCPHTLPFDDLPLVSTEPLVGNWFVKRGDEGPLSAVRYPEQVELHNLSDRQNSCLGCWPGATDLTAMARARALSVMSGFVSASGDRLGTCSESCPTAPLLQGTNPAPPIDGGLEDAGVSDASTAMDAADAGDAASPSDAGTDASGDASEPETPVAEPISVLFWHLERGRVVTTNAPCESVRHLEAFSDVEGVTVQVYCPERRYDYRYMQETLSPEPTAVEYPFGPARWIAPPVKREENGVEVTYLLTASGDDYALNLLRINRDDVGVVETPAANLAIAPADRTVPFRPSISEHIRPARIRDGKYVDVYIAGRGWRQGIARRWIRSAHFSAHDDLAVTVAETLDPSAADFDEIRQTMELYVHDLQVGSDHWGRRLQIRSTAILSHSFHGVAVADYSERINERSVWMGLGRARSPVILSGFGISCNAASD